MFSFQALQNGVQVGRPGELIQLGLHASFHILTQNQPEPQTLPTRFRFESRGKDGRLELTEFYLKAWTIEGAGLTAFDAPPGRNARWLPSRIPARG